MIRMRNADVPSAVKPVSGVRTDERSVPPDGPPLPPRERGQAIRAGEAAGGEADLARGARHGRQAPGLLLEALALSTDTTSINEQLADSRPGAEQSGGLKTFRDFGIAEPICAALEAVGITTAFPIQALTLPVALDGHDLIGQARTGTGKTLAFGIPILERLGDTERQPGAPRALVVVPTRELAIQVADDLRVASARLDASVVTVYGGRAYEPQIEALAGVDVVVGTPGRLLDLAKQGHLKLNRVRQLVLDEADKMLDLGFLPDVERILSLTPAARQTMLFSATMPGEVVTLARRHLSRPMHIRAEQHDEPAHVPTTEQHVFRAHQMDKIEVLARILQAEGRGLTIVFCRTKRSADQVASALTTKGFAAAAVHGDLGQGQRERAMRAFRSGKVDVLVATDVAARGLDVDDVTHVINYECPEDDKAYLHRIGRTGRAGREGVAVTFVDWADLHRWKSINEALHLDFAEPLETYSTSSHLYAALGIAEGATGVLPRGKRDRAGLQAESLEDIGETGKTRSRSASGGRSRADGPDQSHEARTRNPRSRRRTRAGQPAGPADAAGPVLTRAAAPGQGQPGTAAPEQDQAGAGEARRRPRRRRPRSTAGGAEPGQTVSAAQ